jgi:AcrR family transcriptional regulator
MMSTTAIRYDRVMGRWPDGATERLERAALELYQSRGFESTTVAEIAERAGLTERTFYRHYADKREVLFAGSAQLQDLLVRLVAEAEPSLAPIEAITAALTGAAAIFEERRSLVSQRQKVIAANPELQERELIKLAKLAAALAEALGQRGVPEPAATLAAEAGVAVFRVAFDRWIGGGDQRSLAVTITDSASHLRELTSAR